MNTLPLTFLSLALASSAGAGTWIRLNHAGYTPERSKQAIVLSDTDISNQVWTLSRNQQIVLQGKLPSGSPGDQIHVAQAYTYPLDFSEVTTEGTYTLSLAGAASQRVIIHPDPYSVLATQALMHLRAMRSGSDQARLHPASHLGDSVAPVRLPLGDWKQGAWALSEPQRALDMRGGHYDAGDYIKFTLNESYLAWHLLSAYQENPALFTALYHPTLPDILDEAKHSLDYLMRVHPDSNTFVIQVGDGNDHNQGWRLPQKDRLDGKRPALCALSRVHMGSAAAALALGAQVFTPFDADLANHYGKQAERIYLRARQNDTQRSAFERNATNDFYWDDTDQDNLALAATELFRLTQKTVYLEQAKAYAPRSGYEVSWAEWHFQANHRLALLGDASAKNRALNEVSRYESANVWQVPGNYTWGTLHRWIGMANAHFRAQRDFQTPTQDSWLFWGVLDYVMGRNNWGMPLLASGNLPGSIQNIYNSLYRITGVFPTGALSEGPGDKATHLQMRAYFKLPEPNPYEEFNTEAAVFLRQPRRFYDPRSHHRRARGLVIHAGSCLTKKHSTPTRFWNNHPFC